MNTFTNITHGTPAILPLTSSQPFLLEFTLQTWLKAKGAGPLFYYRQDEDHAFQIDVTEQGKLIFAVTSKGQQQIVKTARGGINIDQWLHLSAINNGNELTLYINGRKVMTNAEPEYEFDTAEYGGLTLFRPDDNKFEQITLIPSALQPEQLENYQQTQTENNLITPLVKSTAASNSRQTVKITLCNDSPFDLRRTEVTSDDFSIVFPLELKANKPTSFMLEAPNSLPSFKVSAIYVAEENTDNETAIEIEVTKSLVAYESNVKVVPTPNLERDINVNKNTEQELEVDITLSKNLVIINAEHLNQFINELAPEIGKEKIVTGFNYDEETGQVNSSAKALIRYNKACQLFNRRIQEKPLAIVYCTNSDDVKATFNMAKEYNLPISIRSGGHDHEGECSGTNTILIDLIGLDQFTLDKQKLTHQGLPESIAAIDGLAAIGPGNRFIRLTTKLADCGRMIPHGTCATVAIPGFLMGGGWGPWTRSKGMCCEYLRAAEVILGNGEKEIVSEFNRPEVLWALKGGGGMSYGIVTTLYIETFCLPEELIKFELEWNMYEPKTQALKEKHSTLKVLQRWEQVISSTETNQLNGTNLKINARPQVGEFNYQEIQHNCLMYGYWQGTEDELKAFIKHEFTDHNLEPDDTRIDGIGGSGNLITEYGKNLMGSWDRESLQNIQAGLCGKSGTPLPPDLDEPAPHKITSRLVEAQGLAGKSDCDKGYQQLLLSLTSPLVLEGNRLEGLFSYVTLGAIDGSYYKTLLKQQDSKDNYGSAFPYKDRLYTIQYQTWWNNELTEKLKLQDNKVYTRINRALDWIQEARDFDIPNTSGAFISFKDASIPTETYFSDSYHRLVEIKKCYTDDGEFNHFRKRKTII